MRKCLALVLFAAFAGCAERAPVGGSLGRVLAAIVGSEDRIVHDTPAPGPQSGASIAINAAGTVLVGVYQDARGVPVKSVAGIARSTDGGATWAVVPVGPGGKGLLPPGSGELVGSPSVSYDATRDLFVVASRFIKSPGQNGVSLHVSNADASEWTGPIDVTPAFIGAHDAESPRLDVNATTGRAIVTWTDVSVSGAALAATTSDDLGETWSPAATLVAVSAGDRVAQPRFLPGADNAGSTVYVVFEAGADSDRNVGCARSTDGGATWDAAVDLDAGAFSATDGAPGFSRGRGGVSLAVDASTGRVYVVYSRGDALGTGDIALRSFVGPCQAASPALLSANPGDDRAQLLPAVAVDVASGAVHVLWYDQDPADSGDLTEVMRTSSMDQGTTWSPPAPVLDRPFRAGFGRDVAGRGLGEAFQAVAQGGALHTLVGATAAAPGFADGLPSPSLLTPDAVYDRHLDTEIVAPLRVAAVAVTESSCAALGNGHLDPGETATVSITLESYVANPAVGAKVLTGIGGLLMTTADGVTISEASASWADLAPLGKGAASFTLSVAPDADPGALELLVKVSTDQGAIELPVRIDVGTPGAATTLLAEDFESAAAPALPAGWSSAVGEGPDDPWEVAAGFAPMTTQVAFHDDDGDALEWMRLWSPVVTVPAAAGDGELTLGFDVAYRLEDDPTRLLLALDGLFLHLADVTGVAPAAALRDVLAEAFARELRTGAVDGYPKRLASDLADVSAWSGDSNGVVHVSMRFPGAGMGGRDVQLRFEYIEDASGTCEDAGHAAPCGVAIDNVALKLVPRTSSPCPNADLAIEGADSPDPVLKGGALTYALTATNAGPSGATNVALVHTLPLGATYETAEGPGWTCEHASGVVTCTRPELAVDASAAVVVTVTAPDMVGSIDGVATVAANEFDPNVNNNNVTVSTALEGSCGDDDVDDGEDCDDGLANGSEASCCSASCSFKDEGTPCADATLCNGEETCAGGVCAAGVALDCDDDDPCSVDGCDTVQGCQHAQATDGTSCSDGDTCNGDEACAGGECAAGTALDCDDESACTTDSCDAALGCQHAVLEDGASCGDGTVCNGEEACQAGACVAGTALECDDADPCTSDTCDAATGCASLSVPNGTSCADDDVCNGLERCIAGACTPTIAPNCDDSNGCTVDSCDSTTGCQHAGVADATPCPDATICNGDEVCEAGKCLGGTALDCDDKDVCTIDSCDAAAGCSNVTIEDGGSCSDGDACNGKETCQAGLCTPGESPECDDGNVCTTDACDPGVGCLHVSVPDAAPCPDADACNGTEVCQAGVCTTAKAPNCDDKNPCTTDTCEAAAGCQHAPLADGESCADANACNGDEVCAAGACKPGTSLDCKDADPCTNDTCSKATGCQNTPASNGASCNDGDACNGSETCQAGACTAGKVPDCDDKNACTTDTCDTALGCKHEKLADGTSCADADVCNGAETCQSGTCKGTKLDCDDKNPCSTDTCDAALGCQHAAAAAGTTCADADPCNGDEVCQGDACAAGTPLVCDDDNVCTSDTCKTNEGCKSAPVDDGTSCADADLCTGTETCQSGACAPGATLNCDDGDPCTTDACDPESGCTHEGACPDTGTAGEDAGGTESDAGTATPTADSSSSGCHAGHGAGNGMGALVSIGVVLALALRRRRVKFLA